MQQLSERHYTRQTAVVERVIQFGTGNFLRAFVDWLIDDVNKQQQTDIGVVVVQSTNGSTAARMNEQNGLYTVLTQGLQDGERVDAHTVVECVTRSIALQQQYEDYLQLATAEDIRYIVSNTTEAGIRYEELAYEQRAMPNFVANVTQLLYARYRAFSGDRQKGFVFLPCELIEQNGDTLRQVILQYAQAWALPADFVAWVSEANTFCNTLVDRIVPGYPKDAATVAETLGYEDCLMVMAEPYYIWVIEGGEVLAKALAFDTRWNVLFVDDLSYYRERKVKVLNGAHTALTPLACIANVATVREAVEHAEISVFLTRLLQREVLPTIDAPQQELTMYMNDVVERFKNPFIDHYVKSIALNAISKFKTRNVPIIVQRAKTALPVETLTALAAWIYLYRTPEKFEPTDDAATIAFIRTHSIEAILQNVSLWGVNLDDIVGVRSFVTQTIERFATEAYFAS